MLLTVDNFPQVANVRPPPQHGFDYYSKRERTVQDQVHDTAVFSRYQLAFLADNRSGSPRLPETLSDPDEELEGSSRTRKRKFEIAWCEDDVASRVRKLQRCNLDPRRNTRNRGPTT